MTTPRELKGRTAVVTGASSGIGRAIAERLGRDGASVVLSGRTESPMKESAARIEAAGGAAHLVLGDVRDPGVVDELVRRAEAETGRLDVFVNNAGVSFLGFDHRWRPESWRLMLDTNVFTLLVGSQAAIRRDARREPSGVTSSTSPRSPPTRPELGRLRRDQARGQRDLAHAARRALEDQIQITTVMPGLVATNIGRNGGPRVAGGRWWRCRVSRATIVPGERLPDEVLDQVPSPF